MMQVIFFEGYIGADRFKFRAIPFVESFEFPV